jgi:hypothetical protein
VSLELAPVSEERGFHMKIRNKESQALQASTSSVINVTVISALYSSGATSTSVLNVTLTALS